MKRWLTQHVDMFAVLEGELGRTDLAEHKIEAGYHPSIQGSVENAE